MSEGPKPAVQHVDPGEAPGHLIRRAQQRHQILWSEIVAGGLTSVQFAVLATLEREPELDQRTLSRRLSVDTSTLADVCRRLESRGLLERDRASSDGRRNVLRVSPAGAELLFATAPAVDRVGEKLLENLSRSERETLMSLLRRTLTD